MQATEASMAIQQQANTRMQNMDNQLGQIIEALSEESERSHPSDTDAQPEETNMDDHVSESDYDSGNMMDDTLLDAFEDPPMVEDDEEDSSVKLFFQEYRKKFQTVQVVTDEVTDHCDFHTETPQPFDLPLVSAPEEGKEKISLDDCATEVGLGINESWDAFMESDTEFGGEVVNVHDICGEEKDFSMVHFDHGVAPNLCFETSFELPVTPRVIKVFTHVPYPPEEDESFILHFCADEGYEDHMLPTWTEEFKDLRQLMAFVERKLEMLTISAPLMSVLFESL
ncbi:unnamed protein product [Cuscuta epithymum]|uniref:Uncharacterized protein n=1 Tax=Cuscuta epithymum TaxID=186058 RepID=A0AAV0DA19_9ASTE|nr:unnamed protein product [Cuscuta epithymum]